MKKTKLTSDQLWFAGFKIAEEHYQNGRYASESDWQCVTFVEGHEQFSYINDDQTAGFYMKGMRDYIKYYEETLSQVLNRKETQL